MVACWPKIVIDLHLFLLVNLKIFTYILLDEFFRKNVVRIYKVAEPSCRSFFVDYAPNTPETRLFNDQN